MNALTGSLTVALTTVVLVSGCQTHRPPPTGSLVDIKRSQERQLMFNCVGENSGIRAGGLTPELIDLCREDAAIRVW